MGEEDAANLKDVQKEQEINSSVLLTEVENAVILNPALNLQLGEEKLVQLTVEEEGANMRVAQRALSLVPAFA
jgi:hypothetical protein|tara:strand:+ start:303 stop:521 length:219 start_codon:yes stop_codon:yes gene_type:complete